MSAAIGTVITQIADGVSAFDPADIIDALRGTLDGLAGVLEHPEVLSAMNAIRDAVTDTAAALENVSFAPLADQVITEIDRLTAAFQELDVSTLSTPVQLSLQGALLILPEDLAPIADPLVARLGQVVVEGPLALLKQVEQQPAILRDQIRAFEPGAMVGGALATPYNALMAQVNAFAPSKLLDSAEAELDKLKTRLTAFARPSKLLEPLQAQFDDVLGLFDQLDPSAIVQPLETAIQGAVGAVIEALPVDETFDQLDAVLAPIQQATQVGSATIALLNRMLAMLNGLADPRAQMDAWIDTILANINAITDASPLQPALDAIEMALDGATAAGLNARLNTATLETTLTSLNPQTRLVSLIQAYNGVPRAQLNALPDSPAKAAVVAALDRFNPVDPAFVPPYQRAAELQTAMTEAHSKLTALLADWDSRYHDEGPLASLRGLQATPENLRTWIGEALEDKAGRPIVAILSMLAPMAQVLSAFVSKLQALVDALTGKLTALLNGPGSLGDIRDTIQALLDKLQNFNLDFLTQSIGGVFDNVKGKLNAISPAALGATVDAAFTDMLDSLQIDLLIPPAQIAQLDTAYQNIVEDLEALNPATLVTAVVQPEFEEKIIPLLEVFDPTEVLSSLYARLGGVEEELRAEIARVNEAYQRMLDSIPSISLIPDIGVDIDVDIDVPGF
ncbi:MAG: hypothetical protein IPK19_10860 [Chloroflexi bacterium]|nr:hypothetical protein [Chloroflexota bacterium]